MTCHEHCAHYEVCENLLVASMHWITEGNEVEKLCSDFLREVPVAHWKTRVDRNDYSWLECSNCGFLVENYKACKLGKSSADIVEYKWKACPICMARMIKQEINYEKTSRIF